MAPALGRIARAHEGAATRPDWPGTCSLKLFIQDVTGILDQLDLGAVDLVGHFPRRSGGLRVAAEGQGHVRELLLEDIGYPHPRPPGLPDRPAGDLSFDWQLVGQVRPAIDDPDPEWSAIVARITAPTLLISGGVIRQLTASRNSGQPQPLRWERQVNRTSSSGRAWTGHSQEGAGNSPASPVRGVMRMVVPAGPLSSRRNLVICSTTHSPIPPLLDKDGRSRRGT